MILHAHPRFRAFVTLRSLASSIATAVFLVTLTACGGGGGGGGVTSSANPRGPSPAGNANLAVPIAASVPLTTTDQTKGSVTRSVRQTAPDTYAYANYRVSVTRNAADNDIASLTITDTNNANAEVVMLSASDNVYRGSRLETTTRSTGPHGTVGGGLTFRERQLEDLEDTSTYTYMAVFGADWEIGANASWGAGGYWIQYDRSSGDFVSAGAFADGDSFVETGTRALPTTGIATYQGYMEGVVRMDGSTTEVTEFIWTGDDDGDGIHLDVAFGTTDATTTISGEVRGIIIEGVGLGLRNEDVRTNFEIVLPEAEIDRADGTFEVTGVTTRGRLGITGGRGVAAGEGTGRWGGEFVGKGATGTAPPAVGGTIAIIDDPNTGEPKFGFIGAFGAIRVPDPAP